MTDVRDHGRAQQSRALSTYMQTINSASRAFNMHATHERMLAAHYGEARDVCDQLDVHYARAEQ